MLEGSVTVGSTVIGASCQPVLIAGPCVIESEEHTLRMAHLVRNIADKMGFRAIFKASYDKANRSSIRSYRGPGLDKGLAVLDKARRETGLPVLTDVHDIQQISAAVQAVDMIQIPAFLCRQTDLYLEAGKYQVPVNVKKGQFMSPQDMKNIVEKAVESGITGLTLTERGVSFGYNRLVVDFPGLAVMRNLGVPVVFDATHAVQQPGGGGSYTGGNREFVPLLCRAAVAVGCDALFLEVHDNPDHALSDGPNMVTPDMLESILRQVAAITDVLGDCRDE